MLMTPILLRDMIKLNPLGHRKSVTKIFNKRFCKSITISTGRVQLIWRTNSSSIQLFKLMDLDPDMEEKITRSDQIVLHIEVVTKWAIIDTQPVGHNCQFNREESLQFCFRTVSQRISPSTLTSELQDLVTSSVVANLITTPILIWYASQLINPSLWRLLPKAPIRTKNNLQSSNQRLRLKQISTPSQREEEVFSTENLS